MKITICGSIAFFEEMERAKAALEALGHEVDLPPSKLHDDQGNIISVQDYYALRKSELPADWVWERKKWAMKTHFDKVAWSDAILVLNHEKNGIPGYVGANTLMEMGLALHLDKPILLLHQLPEISYKEELLGMKPIVLDGELGNITQLSF